MRDRTSDRRSAILRHAGSLFARQGYGATTVRQIADAADLLSGSLYHHFPSKEAMLLDIIEDVIAEALRRHRAALATVTDPIVALRSLIRSSLTLIAAKPDAAIVIVGEGRRLARTERFAWLSERTAQTSAMWVRVMADGARSGAFRADLRAATTAHLVQTTVWSMAQWIRAGRPFDPEAAADRVFDLFLHGIAVPGAYRSRDLGHLLGDVGPSTPAIGVPPDLLLPAGPPPAPPEADARTRIVAAASALFANQGYAVTTTRQIAETAGVPVGSLAHHIGSKERLIAEMLTDFHDELSVGFAKDHAEAADPVEQIAAYIARTARVQTENGIAAVMQLNEATLEHLPRRELESLFAYIAFAWHSALDEGMRTGVFRAGLDPDFTHRLVRTAISGSSTVYRAMGVADVAGLYQEVVLAGIGRRHAG